MKTLVWKKVLLSVAIVASLGVVLALESNEELTIMQGLQEDENYTTLVSLLESSGLSSELEGAGSATLFAPTNEAFENYGSEQLNALSENSEELSRVLQGHVLQGAYTVLDLSRAEEGSVSSLSGEPATITQSASGLNVNGADLISTDVDNVYSNGIVHAVSNLMGTEAATAADTAPGAAPVVVITDINNDGVIDDNDVADSNNDGVVDEQDYTAAGVTDTNNDGVVDEQDLAATSPGTAGTTTTDAQTTDTATTTDTTTTDTATGATDLGSYDTSGDGQVDTAEFNAGFEAGNMFARFDGDGDGMISQEEFSQGFFALLDTDGDGTLNDSEWNAASFMLRGDETAPTQ